ncbi:MAG: U32 family peptidase [Clostridiales bacterium]|nr:U32 family peptidase [Clostridiales bacterium]
MNFEILAPAGSWGALIAGVRCGADAVYFSAKSLNARQNAGNFNETEFENAIFYCRSHNVKAYIALNTLCKDSEFDEAYSIVKTALSCGADAFIVQDLGLAKMIRQCFPGAVLHASTQMSVMSPAGAAQLQQLGFSRLVLAREMSKNEIKEIAQQTTLELEAFVHGALCMSVSGQCYLSSIIGRRSGNRGLCAQPCRLPFSAGGGRECALSLKDLSLVNYVQELGRAGVYSLKIEGRMKRAEYVAAAVTAVRRAINGEYDAQFEKTLKDVFSRSGFTAGYFTAQRGSEMFGTRQKEDVVAGTAVLKELSHLYEKETPRVPLDMQCCIKAGEHCVLKAATPFKSVSVRGAVAEKAINKELTESDVGSRISKLGGTQFYAERLDIQLDGGVMLSAAKINELRRMAVEKLNEAEKFPVECRGFEINSRQSIKENEKYYTARFSSAAQIPKKHPFRRVFIPLNSADSDFEKHNAGVELPRAFFGREASVQKRLKELRKAGVTMALCGNLGSCALAQKLGFEVFGDFGLNIMNSASAAAVNQPVLSFELALSELNAISTPHCGAIAYGFLPLMLMRNCPVSADIGCNACNRHAVLTDRTGARFPVKCSPFGYCELLNSVPLYMADRQDEINTEFLHFYFSNESAAQVGRIISLYERGASADFEFTRGLYYRKTR